jgi:hypothetical protein
MQVLGRRPAAVCTVVLHDAVKLDRGQLEGDSFLLLDSERLNGVDRLDNWKAYEASNCVPCCGWCNQAKGTLDPATFIQRACHVAKHNGCPHGEYYPDSFSAPQRRGTFVRFKTNLFIS